MHRLPNIRSLAAPMIRMAAALTESCREREGGRGEQEGRGRLEEGTGCKQSQTEGAVGLRGGGGGTDSLSLGTNCETTAPPFWPLFC